MNSTANFTILIIFDRNILQGYKVWENYNNKIKLRKWQDCSEPCNIQDLDAVWRKNYYTLKDFQIACISPRLVGVTEYVNLNTEGTS